MTMEGKAFAWPHWFNEAFRLLGVGLAVVALVARTVCATPHALEAVEKCLAESSEGPYEAIRRHVERCGDLADQLLELDVSLGARCLYVRATVDALRSSDSADLLSLYNEHLGPFIGKPLRTHDGKELTALFDAVLAIAAGTKEPRHIAGLGTVFEELARRGLSSPDRLSGLLRTYWRAGMFDEAHQAVRDHGPLTDMALPKVAKPPPDVSAGPLAYAVSDDAKTLTPEPVTIGTGVVVVADPDCHFCANAWVAIVADPGLMSLFERYGTLLVPPGALNLQALAEWNRRHPTLKYRVARQESDFKEISGWSTPRFYFFRDGRLVYYYRGWPSGKEKRNKAKLRTGFSLISGRP